MTRERRPRARRSPAEARALLLEAARSELLERGADFELAGVTARAGVSPGLPHHYFGSKAGLVAAVVDEYLERMEREVSGMESPPGLSWKARERRRVECYVGFLARDPLSPLLLGALSGHPAVFERLARSLDRIVGEGARNFAQGQARGEVRRDLPPEVLSAAVHGAIRQVTLQALGRAKRVDRPRLARQIWALVEAWLTPPVGTGSDPSAPVGGMDPPDEPIRLAPWIQSGSAPRDPLLDAGACHMVFGARQSISPGRPALGSP